MSEINFDFFKLKTPYNRFLNNNISKNRDIANWQYQDSIPTFSRFITEVRPNVIIELGSFLGWSAINMAKICKQNGLNTKILCIDTWLGSVEHWRTDMCNSLGSYNYFADGTSVMYDEFCKNVISHDAQDYIIGLPNTTKNMYKILTWLNVSADVIYVDASHEYDDVMDDLKMYYNLLKPNGYIFGDDVCWPTVKKAAEDFALTVQKTVQFTPHNELYFIQK
jgi:predicted O-methyltransferase YrrM